MANEFILSKKAVEDLSEIWEYTFQNWSETQADRYYFMLLDLCQDIADSKAATKQYFEIHSDLFGARAGQHIIFFRPNAAGDIEVLRILHNRMDLRNQMDD
jgi:toxin ParE1/3/4